MARIKHVKKSYMATFNRIVSVDLEKTTKQEKCPIFSKKELEKGLALQHLRISFALSESLLLLLFSTKDVAKYQR